MRVQVLAACAVLAMGIGAAGCDDGASAVETRDRGAADAVQTSAALSETAPSETVAKVETAPLTANRRETVDAKIQRLYERNGADFGAASAEDYLAKVTAFTRTPPPGVERAERPNGDVLLYQASTNTFAVVDRNGSARTMFKPREGAAYWAEQKAAAPTFGRRKAD